MGRIENFALAACVANIGIACQVYLMDNSVIKISELPSIKNILKRAKGLALLDAILIPEWAYRHFSFNSRWGNDGNVMMASMRDGSGAEYFLYFSVAGCVGKVFDGNLSLDADFLLARVPEHFSQFKAEPAFSLNDATFYFWQSVGSEKWAVHPENLDCYSYLDFLKQGAAYYHAWAESYYERDIDFDVLVNVFESLALSLEQLEILNANLTIEDLRADFKEILGTDLPSY